MGYYTRHSITITNRTDSVEHEREIWELSGYGSGLLLAGEAVKWYDHEGDMRAYSKRYPNTLFVLKGEGEESGDIWVEYHKNGKMQRCKARVGFDSFDESKLE